MTRLIRLQFENAWYHVMNRGSGSRDIYKSDERRNLFLELLQNASKIFEIQIHAYCLMDNHYHLLIKTPKANLSRAMQYLGGNYTKWFNRIEKSDGPLFRSRYKAILVDKNAYLLYVSRYIHLNAVDANIVKNPEAYRWSSYCHYLNKEHKPDWLHVDEILSMLSDTKYSTYYKNFVESDLVVAPDEFSLTAFSN